MTGFGKRVLGVVEAVAMVVLVKGIGALPPATASAFGGWLLRTIGPRTGAQRTARKNLARLLPPDQVEALLPKVWDNLGRTFFEYPHLPRLYRDGNIEYCGLDILKPLVDQGKGGVLVAAHMGNWECVPFLAEVGGFDAAVMFRAPNNPQVAKVLEKCRSAAKRITFIAKSMSGTKAAFSFLAAKNFVGLLVDHRYNRGVEVEFLGGTAMVPPTAALMAARFGCPIIPVRVERVEPQKLRVTICPPLELDFTLPKDQFTQVVTQQAMDVIAGWVRERPEQWFWMQKLWP